MLRRDCRDASGMSFVILWESGLPPLNDFFDVVLVRAGVTFGFLVTFHVHKIFLGHLIK